MGRLDELENLRRSLVMLTPNAPNALTREKAMALVEELEEAERRLRRLRGGLVRLLEEDAPDAGR